MVAALRRDASTRRSRSWPSDQRLPAPPRPGGEVALKLLFRKRSAVTEDAGAGAIDGEARVACYVTRQARQRLGNGISDHSISSQLGRAGPHGRAATAAAASHAPMDLGFRG